MGLSAVIRGQDPPGGHMLVLRSSFVAHLLVVARMPGDESHQFAVVGEVC